MKAQMRHLFGTRRTEQEGEHWMTISDLMAGLMMVFLFISIALMRTAFLERDKIKEVAVAYRDGQIAINRALWEEFESDLPKWEAELDAATLAIEFKSPEVLFETGEIALQPRFVEILNDFFPRYLAVLKQFEAAIEEVRIEGHTSSDWDAATGEAEAYFKNMWLSQGRTRGVQGALDNGSVGNKFHVAYCQTLEEMRGKGRYERYVATNDLSGEFYIAGHDPDSGKNIDGRTRLKVCKNCLGKLYYQKYRRRIDRRILDRSVAAFDLEAFFDKYKSFFPHMPSRRAGKFDGQYTADWGEVARRYRERKNFTCENCRLDLRNAPHLLHVHHVNGVKTNNSPANLKALCIQCHSQQPDHSHITISDENAQRIAELRRERG